MRDLLIANQFLEKAPIIVLTLNADGTIGFINDWGCTLLGCKKAAVLGKNWIDLFVADENLHYIKDYYQSIMNGETELLENYENNIRTFKGDVHLISWNSKLLTDAAGRPTGIITIGEDVTDRKVLLKLLVEQEKQSREQVLTEVKKARDNERKDIAFELHDNVSQVLTTCKLLLGQELNGQPAQSAYIAKAYQLLQTAITDIRALSHRLNPDPVAFTDFELSIRDFIEQVSLASGIRFHFEVSGITNEQVSPMAAFSVVFRIIQEQVNNIIKHADATEVFIALHVDEKAINLEIRDNGKGFDLTNSRKGLGLKSIHNRVSLGGGTVYIDTSSGSGCLVSICIPMPV